MKTNRLLCALFVIATGSVSAVSQTAPDLENGLKAYGAYDGGNLDTVNLENGNLMLHIPLSDVYPQRGGKLTPKSVLTLSSKQWQVQCFTPPNSGQSCY